LLRQREKRCEAITVGSAAVGLILAGAVLSQNPWRSVDGYVGHSVGVQLLALISVGTLAASVVGVKSHAVRAPEGHHRGVAVETGVARP
jgi:arabinofuranan 3-O-arabinosyltransferase